MKHLLVCLSLLSFLFLTHVSNVFATSYYASIASQSSIAHSATAVPKNPWGYNFVRGKLIKVPPVKFCNYFKCIANFWKGKGYVVECKDAWYSKGGGLSGVCSGHKGYYLTLYAH